MTPEFDQLVRVRFCPHPRNTPHGLAGTALFNWAYARHKLQGTFVFRIEDTDAARDLRRATRRS